VGGEEGLGEEGEEGAAGTAGGVEDEPFGATPEVRCYQ
jgi:hypothetical protein